MLINYMTAIDGTVSMTLIGISNKDPPYHVNMI